MGATKSSRGHLAYRTDEVGYFTWELASNTLWGDTVLAKLFDIPVDDVKDGIPIERILERIVANDRPRIAQAIHMAILSGDLYEAEYEVNHLDASTAHIVATGRCFQYSNGTPSHFAGSVIGLASADGEGSYDILRTYCEAAASLAKSNGEHLAERYLSSALAVLTGRVGPAGT